MGRSLYLYLPLLWYNIGLVFGATAPLDQVFSFPTNRSHADRCASRSFLIGTTRVSRFLCP